jgi:hydrogenase maturation protein HypF
VVPSQHIGEVAAPAAERFHRSATDHLLKLLEAEPDVVAHDRHPEFRTTTVAADRAATWDTDAIGVYHHHAHAASLLAEHDRERAIVVAADGTGYGPDGVVRGGEVLDSTLAGSERVGGLSEFRLPGGERAVERPGRILASLLGGDGGSDSDGPAADAGGLTDLLVARGAAGTATEATIVREVATDDRHSPVTTSAGRYLDAMSALLDVCTRRRYRGEPALRLEATAALGDPVDLDPPVERSGEGTAVVRVDRAAEQVASLAATESTADAAATAQAVLADGLAAVAVRAATERGIDAVGFTGGVAYNDAISRRLRRAVQAADRTFLGHRAVPPGDAGLAYGQAVTASARLASEAGTR